MAFRAGLLGGRECAAIATVCGDVPPELASGETMARRWPRVLITTGSDDRLYPPGQLEADVAQLKSRGIVPEALVFDGGHEWTEQVCERIGALLEEIEQAA